MEEGGEGMRYADKRPELGQRVTVILADGGRTLDAIYQIREVFFGGWDKYAWHYLGGSYSTRPDDEWGEKA